MRTLTLHLSSPAGSRQHTHCLSCREQTLHSLPLLQGADNTLIAFPAGSRQVRQHTHCLSCREQTTHSLPFLLFKTTKISISPPPFTFFYSFFTWTKCTENTLYEHKNFQEYLTDNEACSPPAVVNHKKADLCEDL